MRKGTLNYLRSTKIKYLIYMSIIAILTIILMVSKSQFEVWIAKYMTILCGVLIIPFSLYMTKLITILPYRTDSYFVNHKEIFGSNVDHIMFDLLLVPTKRTYHLLAVTSDVDTIYIYLNDKRLSSQIITEMYAKRDIQVKCELIACRDQFIQVASKIKQTNETVMSTLAMKSI